MTDVGPKSEEVLPGSRWLYVGPGFDEPVEVMAAHTSWMSDDDIVWLVADGDHGDMGMAFWASVIYLRPLVCEMCGGRGVRERRHVGFSHGFLEECDHGKTIAN